MEVIKIKDILFFIFVIASSIVFTMSATYMHELAHEQIAEKHGCIKGKINVNLFGGYYECNYYNNRTQEIKMQEEYLHAMNEIVGYNANITNSILLMIFFILVYIAFKGD